VIVNISKEQTMDTTIASYSCSSSGRPCSQNLDTSQPSHANIQSFDNMMDSFPLNASPLICLHRSVRCLDLRIFSDPDPSRIPSPCETPCSTPSLSRNNSGAFSRVQLASYDPALMYFGCEEENRKRPLNGDLNDSQKDLKRIRFDAESVSRKRWSVVRTY